jgi:hypothetical protein
MAQADAVFCRPDLLMYLKLAQCFADVVMSQVIFCRRPLILLSASSVESMQSALYKTPLVSVLVP